MVGERQMRRLRQELSETESLEILKTGKVAVLAVAGDDGYPYAVPLNYVYDKGDVYVHSASQGHKIDALRKNPKCSLCIIDKDDITPEKFTSYFRSVMAFGITEFITSDEDKIKALRLLCEKYSPGLDSSEEIDRSLNRVTVIRIRLERITGKEAIELVRRRNN